MAFVTLDDAADVLIVSAVLRANNLLVANFKI